MRELFRLDRECDQRVWTFDPAYSTVEFVVRNFFYNVKGRFSVLEGSHRA